MPRYKAGSSHISAVFMEWGDSSGSLWQRNSLECSHPDEGQQAVLEEAAGLAGALCDGGQQQILGWPGVWVPLQKAQSLGHLLQSGQIPAWRLEQ